MDVTYVLPLRATHPPSPDLVEHLAAIAAVAQVVVADSSSDEVFAANARAWGSFATHVRPDPRHRCANGKVHNVLTALDHVRTEAVVIADDDVRYTPELLRTVVAELAVADVVVPQNVFVTGDGSRMPWHAVWDTARTLLNRVSGGDFPGTLAVRTDALRRTGGYDGDVLFEPGTDAHRRGSRWHGASCGRAVRAAPAAHRSALPRAANAPGLRRVRPTAAAGRPARDRAARAGGAALTAGAGRDGRCCRRRRRDRSTSRRLPTPCARSVVGAGARMVVRARVLRLAGGDRSAARWRAVRRWPSGGGGTLRRRAPATSAPACGRRRA